MDYLPTVWATLALLITIIVGIIARILGFVGKEHIPVFNRYIFTFCLPFLVFKACATQDFYSADWNYVLLFLCLRVTGAVFFVIVTLLMRKSLEFFISSYLSATWLDSIVYGIPILSSLFDDSKEGSLYPVLAAISSFIFQLPFMIVVFEITKVLRIRRKQIDKMALLDEESHSSNNDPPDHIETNCEVFRRISLQILFQLVTVPPIWGIVLGLIFAVFQQPLPTVLSSLSNYMGNCVTGTISFLVGVFIVDVKDFYQRIWKKTIVFVGFKLFIFPLFVFPFIYAFGMKGNSIQSAFVLAAMPLAFPAFSLAKQYELDEDLTCACICLGTVLMLPTTIGWMAIGDVVANL